MYWGTSESTPELVEEIDVEELSWGKWSLFFVFFVVLLVVVGGEGGGRRQIQAQSRSGCET